MLELDLRLGPLAAGEAPGDVRQLDTQLPDGRALDVCLTLLLVFQVEQDLPESCDGCAEKAFSGEVGAQD